MLLDKVKYEKTKTRGKLYKQQEKKSQIKESPIRVTVDFSSEQWGQENNNVFKMLKEKNSQPKIIYLAKLICKI